MDTNKIKSISRLASLLVALGFSLSFYISCKYISYVFVIIAIILSIFCIVKKVRRSLAIITTVVAVITILNIGNTKTKYLSKETNGL